MSTKKKKNLTYYIILSLLIIGVVYAILQANLQINGTAKIGGNTWDIHFDNIQVNSNSVSIGTGDSQATIDPENNCKVDFEVTLSLPGDFYEFTVDVVNAGTIDGMIGELNKTLKVNNEVVSEIPDYLDYSVTYSDGVEILQNHALNAGTTETFLVRLEFRTDIEELPEAATISTSLEPQYIQADTGAVQKPCAMFIDGPTFNIKVKKLAGETRPDNTTFQRTIYSFIRNSTPPDSSNMTSNNLMSVSNSTKPIYVWLDGHTLYYYCEAEEIFLNPDSSHMFHNITCLDTLDIGNLKTSKVVDMSNMFFNCGASSRSMNLDLSNWDVSHVTNMKNTFYYYGYSATTMSLTGLDNWDVSNVTDMSGLFYYLGYGLQSSSTLTFTDISNWNTSKVTDMSHMFEYAGYYVSSFTINVSNWNTSSVRDMSHMFDRCGYNATSWSIGSLTNWNVSNVENMQDMFAYTSKKYSSGNIGDLSNWDTSKVTNMKNMFYYAGVSNIGTLKVYANDISYMFYYASRMRTTIKLYRSPTTYTNAFADAASSGSITVNYHSSVTNIDSILSGSGSRVYKGTEFTE